MSIRGGGRPRGEPPNYDPAAFDEERFPVVEPRVRARRGRGSNDRARDYIVPAGGGIGTLVRFALFSVVIGAFVIMVGLTALRPLVRAAVVSWAWDHTGSFKIGLVADFVREDLGEALTAPGGTSSTGVAFDVLPGDTAVTLAARLKAGGLIDSERAFVFTALDQDLAAQLKAGAYLVRSTMTPAEIVHALVYSPIVVNTVDVTFREGLRLEQITAKLETVTSGVDPKAFYDLVTKPTPELLADFAWLQLPEGATLEGFLYPATYTLVTSSNGPQPVTTAEDLVRMMLTKFASAVGSDLMTVPESRGMTFYQIVTLASIVEREAVLDTERPTIAGVYQNRLDGYKKVAKILNADPTVIYAVDTAKLRDIPIDQWDQYYFWSVPEGGLANVQVPEDLQGYQTYQVAGLVPGPICSPTVASIQAALTPDTASGYLFFVAIPDGNGAHAFAKTLAEHNANLVKYGYK
jgi:UPF0755 protein